MESFVTDDKAVFKYIHDDGSETAIKIVKSCSNFINDQGEVEVNWEDRNKYSVFISTSVGCAVKCPFCFLTIKDAAYKPLEAHRIEKDVKEALDHAFGEVGDQLKNRYIKLCWMGMGDISFSPRTMYDVTVNVLQYAFEKGYAKGLDSVDISTVLPVKASTWETNAAWFKQLNDYISIMNVELNPNSHKKDQASFASQLTYSNRSLVRVFFSLHSAIQSTRTKMVPVGMQLEDCIDVLHNLEQDGINVLFHQVFVEGLNDSDEEVQEIINWMRKHFVKNELRILRYNSCRINSYKEWAKIQEVVTKIADAGINVKVQVSAGSEVQAACGQFLVAITKAVDEK